MFVLKCVIKIPTTVGSVKSMQQHAVLLFGYRVEAIYEAVDEGPRHDVTMTTSPAYEGVKIY